MVIDCRFVRPFAVQLTLLPRYTLRYMHLYTCRWYLPFVHFVRVAGHFIRFPATTMAEGETHTLVNFISHTRSVCVRARTWRGARRADEKEVRLTF